MSRKRSGNGRRPSATLSERQLALSLSVAQHSNDEASDATEKANPKRIDRNKNN